MKPQVELCQEFSDNMASKASEIDDLNDLEENPLENSKFYLTLLHKKIMP